MENHPRGGGDGGKRGRGRGGRLRGMGNRVLYDPEICFNCKQKGHWKNDCPHPLNQVEFQPRGFQKHQQQKKQGD